MGSGRGFKELSGHILFIFIAVSILELLGKQSGKKPHHIVLSEIVYNTRLGVRYSSCGGVVV